MNIGKIAVVVAALLVGIGCKRKLSHADIEAELKKAMTDHLYKSVKYDSSKVKFNVLSVIFYEDKFSYDCEFQVRMIDKNHDTTGQMSAFISKDFSKVNRRQ